MPDAQNRFLSLPSGDLKCNQGGMHLAKLNQGAVKARSHGSRSKLRWLCFDLATAGAALFLIAVHPGVSGQEYSVQNWHLDDGLPDGDITAIQQTRDGFLWIGTPKGLARFDGIQFRVFNTANTPDLTDSRISSLLTDSEGTLWIGTLDGNLLRHQGDQFESMHPPLQETPGLRQNQRSGSWLWARRMQIIEQSQEKEGHKDPGFPQVGTHLAQDGQGALWWRVSGKGLMRFLAGQWRDFSTTNGLPADEMEQLSCDHEGRVWAAANGRLHRFLDDRWDSAEDAVLLGGHWPVLLPAHQGGLWVAEPRGSWLQGGGQVRRLLDGQWHDVLPTIAGSPHANRSVVSCLLEDRTGRIWYGTSSGGLFFSHSGKWQRLNARGQFSQGYISCLFEDQQGNIWVGAVGDGLYRVRQQPVVMLSLPPPMATFEINTVVATRSGSVWIGTGGGGGAQWQDQSPLALYGPAQGLENPHVCALFEDSQTNIWAGTAHGLFRLQGGRFTRVNGPPGLDGWVKALFEDRAGRLWIGAVAGLISCHNGTFIEHPWPIEQLLDTGRRLDIRSIAEDPTGVIWVGTIGQGLFRYPQKPGEAVRRIVNYPAPDARYLHFDEDGTLWIGSWGGGLIRMRNGQFKVFAPADGLPCEKIQSIIPGPDETLWLSSDNGLVGVGLRALDLYEAGLSPPLLCWRISLSEGLGNRCCSGSGQPVSTKTSDGRLWIPNFEGVAILDPRQVIGDKTAVNVVVESVLADGKAIMPAANGEFRTPSSVRRLEFNCVAPDLVAPRELRFRHKLEGLDRDWVDGGAQRVASFTRLAPGRYQFRVVVGGRDGRWHESSKSVSLWVVPHLWELRWVQVLSTSILLASILGGAALNQRRKYHRKLERLEASQALENERRRIARDLHDELGARLTSIAIKGETALQGEGLASSAKPLLGSLIGDVRQLLHATEEVIWATDPKNDSLSNLVDFLGDYLERFIAPTGIAYRLQITPVLPPCTVLAQTRHNLLLAVKEALNNALRHASPTVIRMQIEVEGAWLRVIISDDGHGFDAAAPHPLGRGLANIRNRMELIHGSADLRNQIGEGTTVTLWMPLSNRQNQP